MTNQKCDCRICFNKHVSQCKACAETYEPSTEPEKRLFEVIVGHKIAIWATDQATAERMAQNEEGEFLETLLIETINSHPVLEPELDLETWLKIGISHNWVSNHGWLSQKSMVKARAIKGSRCDCHKD